MVDFHQPVTIPDAPRVSVFRDDRRATGFYVIGQPCVAADDDGRLQLGLAVYGRQEATGFHARGGLLSVTTSLGITPEERRVVSAAITRRLAQELALAEGEHPPTPEWLAVEWVSGMVELAVVSDLILKGSPSLTGENQCAFSINARPTQMGALLDSWEHGLPNAKVTYRMRVRAAGGPAAGTAWETGTASASFNWATAVGGTQTTSVGVEWTSSGPEPFAGPAIVDVEFAGGLVPPDRDLGSFLTKTLL